MGAMITNAAALLHKLREVGGTVTRSDDRWLLHIPSGSPPQFATLLNTFSVEIAAELFLEERQTRNHS